MAEVGGHRPVDAELLKDKTAAAVLEAFKTIDNRGILKKPTGSLRSHFAACKSAAAAHMDMHA